MRERAKNGFSFFGRMFRRRSELERLYRPFRKIEKIKDSKKRDAAIASFFLTHFAGENLRALEKTFGLRAGLRTKTSSIAEKVISSIGQNNRARMAILHIVFEAEKEMDFARNRLKQLTFSLDTVSKYGIEADALRHTLDGEISTWQLILEQVTHTAHLTRKQKR